MRWLSVMRGVALCLCMTTPALAQSPPSEDPLDSLPPGGEGREIVGTLCAACHSLQLVRQQGMSRHRWDQTLVWMVEKQGMPELDPEERTLVLDYLAEHFGEGAQGGVAPPTGLPLRPLLPPLMPAQ